MPSTRAVPFAPARISLLVPLLVVGACGRPPEAAPGVSGAGEKVRTPVAAPVPAAPEAPPVAASGLDLLAIHYRALGTEPFWGVEVTADSLVLEEPETDRVRFRVSKVRRWAGTDVLSGAAGDRTIEVTVERRACSDGMSDRRYAFTARVVVGDRTLAGCAFERPLVAAGGARTEDPTTRAGLAVPVREARDIRARQSDLERYVGSLETSDASRAMFAAHFDGDDVRMIEFRISRDDIVLRETTFYFAGRGGRTPAPSLIDGEMRDGSGGPTTWFLLGFDPSGELIGQRVEIDGEPVDPPGGLVSEELRRARDLVVAARGLRE